MTAVGVYAVVFGLCGGGAYATKKFADYCIANDQEIIRECRGGVSVEDDGAAYSPVESAEVIPEPATLGLLATGGLFGLLNRKKRRK